METGDARAELAALVSASKGDSLVGLSRWLGRNDAYLHQFVTRGSPRRLAEDDRRRLAAYFGVDERRLGATDDRPSTPRRRIARRDVSASAGPGALVEDDQPIGTVEFGERFLYSLGVRNGPVSLIRAWGDSMAPLIQDGDEMLVDEGDRKVLQKGGVFVVRLDGVTLVKRIRRDGKRVMLASENPSAAYIPAQPAEAVEVIGRVVWISRVLR